MNRLAGRRRRSAVFESHTENRPFQRECTIYELLPDAPSSVNQLDLWINHEDQFPFLAGLVRVVFAVPVASSKSERVFSVAGNVVTPKRARLNPEKVEDLVVVKCNLALLKTMGLRS